jgi:transcriptional regulator with XRE-family HTH domain
LSEDQVLSAAHSDSVAERVREELARRRISRQRLADDAKVSLSTLEKALAGRRPFTLATLVRLEDALKVNLRPNHRPGAGAGGLAPESLGAYSHAAVARLEGPYLSIRPSFQDPAEIYAYRTEIIWDEPSSRLVFKESRRLDGAFAQVGEVSLPNQSGHVYLVTNTEGQFRLITLSRPTITGEMYGLLTTLRSGTGSTLTPAAAAIALIPLKVFPEPEFGAIPPSHPRFNAYAEHVRKVTSQSYGMLFRL